MVGQLLQFPSMLHFQRFGRFREYRHHHKIYFLLGLLIFTLIKDLPLFFVFSKATNDLWKKFSEKRLGYIEILFFWIIPILIWLRIWFDDAKFGTGKGDEKGYTCYPIGKNGTVVFITDLERPYLLISDILVLLIIAISGAIVLWSFKNEMKEAEKQMEQEHLLKLKTITDQLKRNLRCSTGGIVLSYVILRTPWMIVSFTSGDFSAEGRISALLYFMKFNVLFLLFAFTNKNYRKAYRDFIKLLFPCCFCKKESIGE